MIVGSLAKTQIVVQNLDILLTHHNNYIPIARYILEVYDYYRASGFVNVLCTY